MFRYIYLVGVGFLVVLTLVLAGCDEQIGSQIGSEIPVPSLEAATEPPAATLEAATETATEPPAPTLATATEAATEPPAPTLATATETPTPATDATSEAPMTGEEMNATMAAARLITATPEPGCSSQTLDLRDGKTADITLTEDSFIWYTGDALFPVFKGEVKGITNASLFDYSTYIAFKKQIHERPEAFTFPAGTYTLFYPPEFPSSEVVIIICPV